MLFDQLIAGANVRRRHLFLRREFIFDDLKHTIKTRQREDQHHHPADSGRFDELLVATADVVQVFAIALSFRVLLAANRHIQLSGGFDRQQLAQPLHQRGGVWRINHEIGAGETEDNARLGAGCQAGVDKKLAVIRTMDRQQKGNGGRGGE
ncbi:hypothetical protein D3C72_1417630 [compost metagenome]